MEKEVSYLSLNTYSTLNQNHGQIETIWMAFHGLGYLSQYFINYFQHLDSKKNYIIAPQAPSKYYLNSEFKYVGASWLTKHDTVKEIENVQQYLKSVSIQENLHEDQQKLIVFGYSQGVSIALRWLAKSQFACKVVCIHSGGIPKELVKEDFDFLPETTRVYLIYGKQDEYLTETRIQEELNRGQELFGTRLMVLPFEGKHVINTKIIEEISKNQTSFSGEKL